MAAYPPEWSVHAELDFESFHLAPVEGQSTSMVVLARVDLEGRLTGEFKCCVHGGGVCSSFRIPASRMMNKPPPSFANSYFEVSADTEDMTPPNNCMAGTWTDLLASLKDRSIRFVNEEGDSLDSTPIIQYLSDLAEEGLGYSTRWAVAATASTSPPSLQSEFQMLPAPAKSLSKSNLKADNCVSVQVKNLISTVTFFIYFRLDIVRLYLSVCQLS